jgi:hypothetical protein
MTRLREMPDFRELIKKKRDYYYSTFGNGRRQITIGCGYDANVGGNNSVTARSFELPLLKYWEQCNLGRCGKIADRV